jgi:hypothetical protein
MSRRGGGMLSAALRGGGEMLSAALRRGGEMLYAAVAACRRGGGVRCAAVAACVIACLAVLAARARAQPPAPPSSSSGDAVALLPLDAGRSLELYGQPVARAIARALEDGKVPVVVVGPRMAVPERARLILDGTIAAGKAGAVTITLRLRSTVDGKVLETLSAAAPGLAKLDVTAAELSARLLPIVQARLAALRAPPSDDRGPPRSEPARAPAAAPDRFVAIALADASRPSSGALVTAIEAAAADWARAHGRQSRKLDASQLDPRVAAQAVATTGADLAIGFWILAYTPETAALPMARARVRVRIADAGAVLFDRVVATDTVLGERGMAPSALAARVAREVFDILRPHVRRRVPTWR